MLYVHTTRTYSFLVIFFFCIFFFGYSGPCCRCQSSLSVFHVVLYRIYTFCTLFIKREDARMQSSVCSTSQKKSWFLPLTMTVPCIYLCVFARVGVCACVCCVPMWTCVLCSANCSFSHLCFVFALPKSNFCWMRACIICNHHDDVGYNTEKLL